MRDPILVIKFGGDRILSCVHRLKITPHLAGREMERAPASGEALSSSSLAGCLRALELPARSLSGGEAGIHADGEFGAGTITRVDPEPIRRLLRQEVIPVVAGFQGVRPTARRSRGTGDSDTTAVALAAALGSLCHLITDVGAVCDPDPNLDSTARSHPELRHVELLRLSEDGARVVHSGAARLALEHRVPLWIYSDLAPFGKPLWGVESRGSRVEGLESRLATPDHSKNRRRP